MGVRLKGAYVIKAKEVLKDLNGDITEIKCTYDPLSKSGMTIDRKIKGTIHWVSIEHGINIPVNEYDRLFNVETPGDDFISELNTNSLVVNNKAVFEPHVLNVKEAVQMMRKGYYILDKFGKAFNKTVSLKESWNG